MISSLNQTNAYFETTSWTLIHQLDEATSDEAKREISAAIVNRYWAPVYAFLRRQGRPHADADDLTQGFFTDVVLSRGLFEGVSENGAKLRTLVLRALKNYTIDQYRKAARRPSGVSIDAATVDAIEASMAERPNDTGEELFDREWAISLFRNAAAKCEKHFVSAGREKHWRAFEMKFIHRAFNNVDPTYEQIAKELGFETSERASSAAHSVKKRFRICLEQEVAGTLAEGAAFEQEMAFVKSALGVG